MSPAHLDLRRGPPRVIGLTGGIGAGKSTVLALLKDQGATTVDSDAVVHGVLETSRSVQRSVIRLLGPGVLRPEGSLDRRQIAARVFQQPVVRKKLEALLHPFVRREFVRRIRSHRRGWLVLEAPLLFEAGLDRLMDQTWVVWAPAHVCRERLVRQRGFSAAEVRRRLRAQMPPAEKRRRADRVIRNDGPRRALRAEIVRLISDGPPVRPGPGDSVSRLPRAPKNSLK